jgi:hypothetical protein
LDEWSRDLLKPNDRMVLDHADANSNVITDGDVQEFETLFIELK